MTAKLQLPICAFAWLTFDRRQQNWCSKIWAVAASLLLALSGQAWAMESGPNNAHTSVTSPVAGAMNCLPNDAGFLRARLSGSIKAELNWRADMECSGATRPDGGARLRFSHAFGKASQQLVLLFGIPALREAQDGRNLPVNLTVIKQGAGKFYGTRGDNKCSIETLHQKALADVPTRNRSYRIEASGFCMQPARAVAGNGEVLLVRFDFAGRIDFDTAESASDDGTRVNQSMTIIPNTNTSGANR